MENLENIRLFCSKCAPKPIDYQGDLDNLVGRFVKIGFPAEGMNTEHMWVKVFLIDEDSIIGTLDNTPMYTDWIELGDCVMASRDAIEDVYG
jgi:uncharacterized protein YegJ (DUF2314 family)